MRRCGRWECEWKRGGPSPCVCWNGVQRAAQIELQIHQIRQLLRLDERYGLQATRFLSEGGTRAPSSFPPPPSYPSSPARWYDPHALTSLPLQASPPANMPHTHPHLASSASSTRAAGSVHKKLWLGGEVEIDDIVEQRHVDPTGSHIRHQKNLEGGERASRSQRGEIGKQVEGGGGRERSWVKGREGRGGGGGKGTCMQECRRRGEREEREGGRDEVRDLRTGRRGRHEPELHLHGLYW